MSKPQSEPERSDLRPGAMSALLQELVRDRHEEVAPWDGALRPGAVIGRFELVRELARGGFGIVWEARDLELGRTVAFKALRSSARRDLAERRLLHEAEAAARLSHPNVVTLFDVGRCEHGAYLILELLRGQTLARRLEGPPLGTAGSVRVAVEVARGLAHAHAEGVVHRDLTPGNVFLCDDGRVKVLDLGLSHLFGSRNVEGGTLPYMAPEQCRGAPEDERTDVFALGVLLFRMLSGELPFGEAGCGRGGFGARPAPRLRVEEAPPLAELVAAMLQRDPVQRPRDAGAVLEALLGIEAGLRRTLAPTARAAHHVRRRLRAPAWIAAAALTATAAVLGVSAARRWRTPPAAPSIAVLPFADLSPGQDRRYLAEGLSDEILAALSRVPGLKVAGRGSSFTVAQQAGDVRSIGARLRVGMVLEGSIRTSGERARIAAEIVSVADGYRVWSQSYDRDLKDVLAVEEEIAGAAVEALQLNVLARDRARVLRPPRPDVHEAYLRARQLRAPHNADGARRTVRAFEAVLALDASYAPAWVGLAQGFILVADYADTLDAHREACRRGLDAVERAVELGPELADAFSERALYREVCRRDWAGARADCDRALALAPGDVSALRRDAILRFYLGRPAEAVAVLWRVADLDPLTSASWRWLGWTAVAAGDLATARTAATRALELEPGYEEAFEILGDVELLDGHPEAAIAQYAHVRSDSDRWPRVAMAQHTLGDDRESRRTLQTMTAKYASDDPYGIGQVHAWRGERDAALEWLERSIASGELGVVEMKVDPFLRSLHGDPRFAALLRRLRLPAN